MTTRRSIGDGHRATQGGVLAVGSLILGATLWGVVWYPLRLLEAAGLAGLWSSLVIYLAALVIAPLLLRGAVSVARENGAWLLALGLSAGWCNVAFILAVLDGTVVRVLLLFYLAPLWAVLMGHWLLGERITATSVAVLVLAISGAVVMLWDPAAGFPWPQDHSDWLALSSGFAFGLSNVMIRRLHRVAVGIKTTVAWLGVVVVAAVGLGATGSALPSVEFVVLLAAAALGLCGMTVMTLSVQYGVTHLPIQRSSIILLFELVAGALSAYWLAGEVLRGSEWFGAALIVAAAYLSGRTTPA